MNTADKLLKELYKETKKFPYYKKHSFIEKETCLLKVRVYVENLVFIQIYRNDDKRLTRLSLIVANKRIFGRDEERGRWHKHPLENPTFHDESLEGQRKVSVKFFLAEVDYILKELKIIGDKK